MKPTLSRARGTQNLNSSPLRCTKSVDRFMDEWTRMKATCLDIIFVVPPFLSQEASDDVGIKSIMIDVFVLPHCIGRNRLRHD